MVARKAFVQAAWVAGVGFLAWAGILWAGGWLNTGNIWIDASGWIPIAIAAWWFVTYRRLMLRNHAGNMPASDEGGENE